MPTVQVGTLITSSVEVTSRILEILQDRAQDLGISQTYYGRQDIMPDFPSVCVESMPKNRAWNGAGHRFEVVLRTGLLVYVGKIQSSTVTKKESEQLAESIENVLHEDFTLGGRVIHGMVTRVDYGVSRIEDVMIRSVRLQWEAESREQF